MSETSTQPSGSSQGRPDVDPERIGGIGLSVGGEMMIAAAAESTALKAIVSEGASGRSVRDIVANPEHDLAGGHRQQHRDGGDGGLLERSPADRICRASCRGSPARCSSSTGSVVSRREEPANKAFYAAAHAPRQIWEVPGSGHIGGTEARPLEYERRIVGFFDRTLLGDA